jgi:hypothetical protein
MIHHERLTESTSLDNKSFAACASFSVLTRPQDFIYLKNEIFLTEFFNIELLI